MNLARAEVQRDRLDRDGHGHGHRGHHAPSTWQIERALLEMMDESLAQGKLTGRTQFPKERKRRCRRSAESDKHVTILFRKTTQHRVYPVQSAGSGPRARMRQL